MKPNCWDCEHFERVRMYAYCHGGKRVTKLANKYWYSGTVKFCSDFKPHISEKSREERKLIKEL